MKNQEFMREVVINGVKMEIDLRTATKIDSYKIGDNIKVLKKGYSDNFNVYSGVIVDFVNFKERPAIVVAYYEQDYSGVEIKFETITKDSKDIEIAACLPHELKINKSRVLDKFEIAINEKKKEIDTLEQKRDYFVENFGKFFSIKE